jgi:hypothetical protein
MNATDIVSRFASKDSHAIWLATWEILRSKDRLELAKLRPHIPELERILSQVELGGMFHRNQEDTINAFRHIEDMCSGQCHCVRYPGQNLLDPRNEERHDLVKVTATEIRQDLYEAHLQAHCTECGRRFFVREVIGWHMPWYEWKVL